jgi:hypothetical protein
VKISKWPSKVSCARPKLSNSCAYVEVGQTAGKEVHGRRFEVSQSLEAESGSKWDRTGGIDILPR